MKLWFTADHHFGHADIIDSRHRPFSSPAEMDETMIERWNATVGDCDEVWHLGNFAYRCAPNRMAELFAQLSGNAIHLVRSKHDQQATLNLPWSSVRQYAEIRFGGRLLIAFDHSQNNSSNFDRRSVILHGCCVEDHAHDTTCCNVGVDAWDFRPVSLEEIIDRLESADR